MDRVKGGDSSEAARRRFFRDYFDFHRWIRAQPKSPSPTKKPSPVRKVERQIASGKGPDTIAGSNTYKALCAVCKKWGLPTGTIAQKADMATALIVEQWKKMTSAA